MKRLIVGMVLMILAGMGKAEAGIIGNSFRHGLTAIQASSQKNSQTDCKQNLNGDFHCRTY